ncbi:MAG: DUF2141 domain-containing protein [Urechidicola sp.]|nr:DUF2141 domain-containing protein [Urechidicola sp.]
MVRVVLVIAMSLGSFLGFSQETTTNKSFDVVVTINNIQSNEGTVYYVLYDSAEAMMNRKAIQRQMAIVKDGASAIIFTNVKAGVYSIVCFHDENDNKQMDFNEMGMPLEKYGVSNNAINPYGPPNFSTTKFDVIDTNLTFEIELF